MNAAEHIIEAYFRMCKNCFTMHDVKVSEGNNRQLDLLAVNLKDQQPYHVEISIMHTFLPSTENLKTNFDERFLGAPSPEKDVAKGKSYKEAIQKTCTSVGIDPARINRVWVTWAVKDPETLPTFLAEYHKQNGMRVEVKSLRDEIIPELQKEVAAANYDDEVLRTLSLLKQKELQTQPRPSANTAEPRA